jgi:hypothetical protein
VAPATAAADPEYYGLLFDNHFRMTVLTCAVNGKPAGDPRWRVQVEFHHAGGPGMRAHVRVLNSKGRSLSHQSRWMRRDERETIRTTTRVGSNQKIWIYATPRFSRNPDDGGDEFRPVHPSNFDRC